MKPYDRISRFDISRRKIIVLLGSAMFAGRIGAQSVPARSTGAKLPSCIVTPEQTEGPYFVDDRLNRSDIRTDPSDGSVKAGVPLTLRLRISSVSNVSCAPLAGAVIDIWHCDASGTYSDATDRSFKTTGKKFLRGYQVTNAEGDAQFVTIYPGAYPGRAVHIHFKVRTKGVSGRDYDFTSQLYFDDALTDRILAQKPYITHGKRTRNDADGLFRNGGRQLMLTPIEHVQGYSAAFDVGIQMA